jgi:signal transduction histidine kinase
MKSIRTKLILSFMLIVIITVFTLEILLVDVIRKNYYRTLEDNMVNRIKISSDIYLGYFSDATLHENVLNNVDTFWKQTPAQVQIIDLDGKVLMDSIGVIPADKLDTADVKNALGGKIGKWMGRVGYDSHRVLAVSSPLKSGDSIVGVLRFVTSLKEANIEIEKIAKVFIIIGTMVIFICGLLSFILANSIVGPLKEITNTAGEMALGNFGVKCRKREDNELGKLSDTMNFMAEEIVKKDQLKNEFISSVSHELRTPLTSIKGWAVTLKDGGLQDDNMLKDGLDIIETESDRLTAMVEELLDFSRFISGKVTIRREKVNVKKLMKHIKTQLTPKADKDNINFTVVCQEGIPFIVSDENRLKQIFINILDNAFKYTPAKGSITFTSHVDANRVVFCIKDTGVGIPQEELPKVKEKFFKGKNSRPGSGIGLSVCDELVNLMGGAFEIKSKANGGTDVYISIPVKGDEQIE